MKSRPDPILSTAITGPILQARRIAGPSEAGVDRHEVAYWVPAGAPARTDNRSESRAPHAAALGTDS